MIFTENVQLALDTLKKISTEGISTGFIHIMEHSVIERHVNAQAGEYVNNLHGVYVKTLQN